MLRGLIKSVTVSQSIPVKAVKLFNQALESSEGALSAPTCACSNKATDGLATDRMECMGL